MAIQTQTLLRKLGIRAENFGGFDSTGWIKETHDKTISSINPTTNKTIADVRIASKSAYDRVIVSAQKTFERWRNTPAPKRGEFVRDLGNALREMKEPLGDLVTLEMGKIRAEGHGEVQEMIDICDFAVGLSRQLYGLTMHSERAGHRMYEQWHPLGPIGVITAFNFPVAVWSWNAALAAVCGDTVVWKPSPQTPLTAIATMNICDKVMRDHNARGVFNLVIGANDVVGEAMLNDARLPLISFTGSTQVGKHVAETVARRLGKTILELGGNNAIIVTKDADLDLAVRAIVFGSVGTAGQRCTSTRRILMHKSISSELTRRLNSAYAQAIKRIGNPLDSKTLVGPLSNSNAVEKMKQAIAQAKRDGGKILIGGKPRPDIGANFVEPTLIAMPSQSEIVKRETFAPILYLMEFENLDEAIAMHNDVPQGLSSAIFTNNMREMEAFLASGGSDCGIANVNIGTSGAEIGGAFGGEKETGGGRESGSDAWKAYMRRQTNTINYSRNLPLAQGIEFGDS
jgi:aldehyde dehydrogenase (NAD+)